MWKTILIKIIKGENNIESPFHKDGILKYKFVLFNKEERLGFLVFWCSKTKKGGRFSRVGVPKNSDYIFIEDFEKKLPDIQFVDIDFNK